MAALGALGLVAVIVALGALLDLGPFEDEGSTSLSKAEFIAKGDEICERAHEQFAELQKTPPNSAEGAVALTQNLIEISENELNQIRALDAPAEVASRRSTATCEAREQGIAVLKQGLEAAQDRNARAYADAQAESRRRSGAPPEARPGGGLQRVQRGPGRHRRRLGVA